MPIGDGLIGNKLVPLTRELSQNLQVVDASTSGIKRVGSLLSKEDKSTLADMGTFGIGQVAKKQQMEGIPKLPVAPLLSPQELTPPGELHVPDGITPDGAPNAEQISGIGSALKKFGDALKEPGVQKLLIALGAQIDPRGLSELGAIGLDAAEAEARRRFQETGVAGRGLSAEGERTVRADIAAEEDRQFQREVVEAREDRAERSLEIDEAEEARTGALAPIREKLLTAQAEAAEVQLSQLESEFARSESFDPNASFRTGAKALGISVPENLGDLGAFNQKDIIGLLRELGATQRTRINASRVSSGGLPRGTARERFLASLTPQNRQTLIDGYKEQIKGLEETLVDAEKKIQSGVLTPAEVLNARRLLGQLREDIAELGGTL